MITGPATKTGWICLPLFLALLTLASGAPASEGPHEIERVEDPVGRSKKGDGVYGRFNGDVAFEIGAGVEIAPATVAARPLIYGDFSFYQTAGLYASYRQAVAEQDEPLRVLSLGVNLSPLFYFRWTKARESGRAFLDLAIDSLELSAGLHGDQPRGGKFFEQLGFEGGLGLGVPLMARANGLWLRGRGVLLTGDGPVTGTAWILLTFQGFSHVGLLPVDG